jgi:O-antigen/teichoic acid export membrane protein
MKYKSYIRKLRKENLFSAVYKTSSAKAIIQSSAKIIIVQVIAAFLLFANSFTIIKISDERIYGSYVSIMAWVNLFSVIVVFGFEDYFIATIPKIHSRRETENYALSVLLRALIILLIIFSLLTIVLIILNNSNLFEQALHQNQIYFFLLLFEVSVLNILIAFFRSLNKIVFGQVIDKLLRPVLMILFTVLLFIILRQLSLGLVLLMQVAVLLTVIIFLGVQLRKAFSSFPRPGNIFDKSLKLNAAFLLISILNLLSVRLDILFLTKTVLPEQVGYYNLGVRLADVIGFPLAAMNLVVPTFLSKESADHSFSIKKVVRDTSVITFVATLVIYLPLVLFGKYVLSFFGKHFIQGYWPMVILGGTNLISSMSHQMNGYLMISGKQNFSLICLIINVISVFIFCWLLIPRLALTGAALSVLLGSAIYFIAIVIVFMRVAN